MPKAFISYAWKPDGQKPWAMEFAARLRRDGIEAVLDQWETAPGDQLPAFMERAIASNDFVLIICTPEYKRRADDRVGGVGYEGDIMTGEILRLRNHRKFIPVLRSGNQHDSIPVALDGHYFVDLRGDPFAEDQYQDLVTTLHGERTAAPPVVPRPSRVVDPSGAVAGAVRAVPRPAADEFVPIRILGVAVDEVGTPRNDGTHGSALYAVPFRLSREPPWGWGDLFVAAWDRPPEFTGMHRPRIARVDGDRVVLDGTTLDEVQRYHRKTLKLVLDKANTDFVREDRLRRQREEAQVRAAEEHRREVAEAASRLRFDDDE